MNRDILKEMIKKHEGEQLKPYRCPSGKLTIGYGRNLEGKGISHTESLYLLNNDIEEVLADLNSIFKEYFLYPESIQLVLADMRYNLGYSGFRGFKNMIRAARERNWKMMRKEMINSNWYNQVGNRAHDLATIVQAVE